jgi:uncharacterized SAM-binding protein YcdF (DUF218 family)
MVGEGVIGLSSYWRSVYAAAVYRTGGFSRIIVSGGPPSDSVAAAMKRMLIASGVPASAIELETASYSTRTNALNVADMLRGEHARRVLLTSDYHMYRASRAFAKIGLEVSPRPVPDAIKQSQGWMDRWTVFLQLSKETAKIAYYNARGWI